MNTVATRVFIMRFKPAYGNMYRFMRIKPAGEVVKKRKKRISIDDAK